MVIKHPTARQPEKNKPKSDKKKPMEFTGDAKVDIVFYQKVIRSEPNQVGQIVSIVSNLSSYIRNKGFL